MEREYWDFMVDMRQQIVETIGGISNANSTLWWDDTVPNYRIRSKLERMLNATVRDISQFGVFVVTRHTDCGRISHEAASDENGYLWTDPYGLKVKWLDDRFEWGRDQLFQGPREGRCPCSRDNPWSSHHIICDFIYRSDADPKVYQTISSVLCDIQSAIEEAGDRMPRSGIREYLLRATLTLNNAIMPMTVEQRIASRKSEG